ncbi:MAG: DUF2905 family protein [Coriobacteriia bacterium]|nr:DUF2905 family protein [Coriobacteriia bacterium]
MDRQPVDPMSQMGLLMVLAGLALAGLGALFYFGARLGLGRLPGNLQLNGENWSCFVPITASIILSLLLTLVLNLIIRYWR